MQEIVIHMPLRFGPIDGGYGGWIDIETADGSRKLKFTYEHAEHLITALREAQVQITKEMLRVGKTPVHTTRIKKVLKLEGSVDPLQEVAILKTRFVDQTTQDTPIPKADIPRIVQFLNQALAGFGTRGSA
jgi:hypothetical protein